MQRLRQLRHSRLVSLFVETFSEWRRDNTSRLAGALAYFAVLSIAPLLLITVTIVGLVTNQNTVQGDVYNQLANVIGTNSANLVQGMVRSVNRSQSGGLAAVFSILTMIYGATGIFTRLQEALNTIWEIDVKQGQGILRTIKRWLWSAVMLPVIGVVFLLALALNTALSAVEHFFGNQIPHMGYIYLLQGSSFLLSATVITFLFAVIYKYLPDADTEWEDVLTGAAFTAVLFGVGQLALSSYLSHSSVVSAYGAAGTFMVILLWVYYSAQIFLFGAEFTQVFARQRGSKIEPASYAYRLSADNPDRTPHQGFTEGSD